MRLIVRPRNFLPELSNKINRVIFIVLCDQSDGRKDLMQLMLDAEDEGDETWRKPDTWSLEGHALDTGDVTPIPATNGHEPTETSGTAETKPRPTLRKTLTNEVTCFI